MSEVDPAIVHAVDRATSGQRLDPPEILRLFAARDADYRHVTGAADALRQAVSGDVIRYVVNRNINYTNICYFRCNFCAFSKGRTHEDLRGAPYDLALDEVKRRAVEAWERGATEVCLQGGIHPDYTGETYVAICSAIKEAVPGMHIHAFSPLEVTQGAATLKQPIAAFLASLQGGRPRHLAGHGGRDPRRRGPRHHLPGQDQHRRVARRAARRRTSSACARPRPSCTAMSRRRLPGRGICWRCATCRSRPAASPNSCRCRSCTWKRRCTARAGPAAGRPSARR